MVGRLISRLSRRCRSAAHQMETPSSQAPELRSDGEVVAAWEGAGPCHCHSGAPFRGTVLVWGGRGRRLRA